MESEKKLDELQPEKKSLHGERVGYKQKDKVKSVVIGGDDCKNLWLSKKVNDQNRPNTLLMYFIIMYKHHRHGTPSEWFAEAREMARNCCARIDIKFKINMCTT